MKPLLGSYSDHIYSVTRVVTGLLFLQHGAQKLFGVLGREEAVDLFSRLGLAAVIELVGGALIAVGLFTPWVAFIAAGEMASAFFLAHFPRGFWPIMNAGEPAVLFCFVFLYFASRDSGVWSIDRVMRGNKS